MSDPPTPRADAERRHAFTSDYTRGFRPAGLVVRIDFARQLERELAVAREQRDRLAEALRACREDSCELLGERSWWKDEERADFRERYDTTAENIIRADEALDSIKGGTSD